MFTSICSWWNYNKYYFMFFGSLLFLLIVYIVKKLSNRAYRQTAKRLKYMQQIYNDYGFDNFLATDDEIPAVVTKEKRRMMPEVSKGELACKNYLENKFGVNFNKVRPNLLKNNVTGNNLELDLYNEELGLAVEYNGKQHYKYCPGIHRNYEHFQTQKYRDEIKKHLCKDNNIILIEVPYWEKNLESFLESQLIAKGYDKHFIQ